MSVVFVGSVSISSATAEDLDRGEIVKRLSKPAGKTRSIKSAVKSGVSETDREFLDSVTKRGIKFNLAEKDKVAKIVSSPEFPKLDFEINFEFGSSAIRGDSKPQLIELSSALSHASLTGTKVLLIGHTDAKGSLAFNDQLSEDRAQSVKDFLVAVGGINHSRLINFGYGERRLKNKADPHAAENRRVEIINITVQ